MNSSPYNDRDPLGRGNKRVTSMFNWNGLLKTATQRFTVAGAAFGFLFPIVATALSLLLDHLPFSLASMLQVQRTQPLLWIIDSAPFFLGLFASLGGRREDALQQANENLRRLSQELEWRVADRTRELERRAVQMPAIIEISHAVSQVHDPDGLLRRVVELIRESLDLYYVAIFLVDEACQSAVLRAGTGEPGRIMLEDKHRLAVGGNSMVGWACAHKQARIALDVSQELVRFANPLLPETRSELALPLRVGESLLGALDIQSTQARAFDDNDVTVLQSMADQIAVAMENARLFQQAQASLKELEQANRLLTRQTWQSYSRVQTTDFTEFHRAGLAPFTPEETHSLPEESGTHASHRLDIPLTLRGEAIGTLVVERTLDQPAWTPFERELLETVATQSAQTMDSVRLSEESQRLAAREQVISSVTARMRESLDMDTMLKTAVQEVRQALGLPEVVVRLVPPAETDAVASGDGQHGGEKFV